MSGQLVIEIRNDHAEICYNNQSISKIITPPLLEDSELQEITELLDQPDTPKSSILLARREQLRDKLPSLGRKLYRNVFGEADEDTDKFINGVLSDDNEKTLTLICNTPSILTLPWELLLGDNYKEYWFIDYFTEVRRASHSIDSNNNQIPQVRKNFRVISMIARPEGFFDIRFHDISGTGLEVFRNHY